MIKFRINFSTPVTLLLSLIYIFASLYCWSLRFICKTWMRNKSCSCAKICYVLYLNFSSVSKVVSRNFVSFFFFFFLHSIFKTLRNTSIGFFTFNNFQRGQNYWEKEETCGTVNSVNGIFLKWRCATKEDLYLPPRDFRYRKSSFTRFHISNYASYVCMYSCDPSDRHNREIQKYIIDKLCDSERDGSMVFLYT